MSPHNLFDDPKLVTELAQAFEFIWLVMRAHDPLLDADRAKDLSIEISRKLVELAAAGVTDPAQLRRLALESCRSPRHISQRSRLSTHRSHAWGVGFGRRSFAAACELLESCV